MIEQRYAVTDRRFAGPSDLDMRHVFGCALTDGIIGAQRRDDALVDLDPDGQRRIGREDIDYAAAHGDFARLVDPVVDDITHRHALCLEGVEVERGPRGKHRRSLVESEGRRVEVSGRLCAGYADQAGYRRSADAKRATGARPPPADRHWRAMPGRRRPAARRWRARRPRWLPVTARRRRRRSPPRAGRRRRYTAGRRARSARRYGLRCEGWSCHTCPMAASATFSRDAKCRAASLCGPRLTTWHPAAIAAATPAAASSSTTQSRGATPSLLGGPEKDVGRGLGPRHRGAVGDDMETPLDPKPGENGARIAT